VVNPSWAKGYARKGAALHGARRYDDAIAAYEEGLKLEDSPALRKGLKEVQDAKGISPYPIGGPMAHVLLAMGDKEELTGFGKMFADPNLFGKLASNPRTQKHLADPAFVQKASKQTCRFSPRLILSLQLNMIQKNPAMADMFVLTF
jgi:stress-induced-phosphoprotein 1